MKKNCLIFFSAGIFLLTACSNENQVYGVGLVSQKITGDENAVSVWNVYSAGDALPLAKRHCASYGKDAVFTNMSGFITANFQCR